MKILIVDELCYPQMGGQQVRFKELAEEWVKQGHSVEIAAIDHIGDLPSVEVINNVIYNRILHDVNYYKSGHFGRSITSIFKFTFKLKPFFKKEWDVIIFNQFPMLPSLFYQYFYKKRAFTFLDFVEHRDSKLWKFINTQIINATDAVICISEHVKQCANLYRKDNLFVIPSLVNTKLARSVKRENYVFLGRLENHKHPDHAIEAVLLYNLQYKANKVIHVMGKGNMYDELINKYGYNEHVIFHGNVDDVQKNRILAEARILLLPSEREGLPKVVIEAMAYGIPTLTTNYQGNGTQFFVAAEGIGQVLEPNIPDLAKGIYLIEADYEKYVNRCLQIKDNFDLNINSIKYLDIKKSE